MTTAPNRDATRTFGQRRGLLFCLVIGGLATLAAPGCACRRATLTTYAAPVPEAGVVFVADGAGNYQNASRALDNASKEGGFPLQIVTFEWSHGYLRSFADLVHYSYARAQGRRLAETVLAYRRDNPGRPVHLAGHSAGATVVLAALECLPPETVDRAVLISPSLSAGYDVRPALRGVKHGLHNFHSQRDWVYCGLITRVLGNSDRNRQACSGRVGFRVLAMPGDEYFLSKMFQRPWSPADAETGNQGGHFGNYESAFLRQWVLPMFLAR
jgi:pimeloyl-ACP methyl ester carboxylesterase